MGAQHRETTTSPVSPSKPTEHDAAALERRVLAGCVRRSQLLPGSGPPGTGDHLPDDGRQTVIDRLGIAELELEVVHDHPAGATVSSRIHQ